MGELGSLVGGLGAFAYAVGKNGREEIISFGAHAAVRPVFQNARSGQVVSTFVKNATEQFAVMGGNKHVEVVEFHEQPPSFRFFEFRCETPMSRGGHRGYFITAQLLTQHRESNEADETVKGSVLKRIGS